MDMPVAFRNAADQAAAAMLIEGKIVERAPVGSPHAGMVKILNRFFGRLAGDQAIISVQDPLPSPSGYRTSFSLQGEESVTALALPAIVGPVAALCFLGSDADPAPLRAVPAGSP